MNYRNKKVAITGCTGFIGSKLHSRLKELDADILLIYGDTRDPATFDSLDYEFDYLFHFAAPSSQILFKSKPMYAADVTINGFINAANACRKHGIKLIYPSTGILSSDRMNEYARCKKICEDIHLGENLNALGLRIFMGYGPNENHKSTWASPAYLFAHDIVFGKHPVVWGDGSQTRDLIYIDDLVEAILVLAEEATEKIIDIGTGNPVSFKEMINTIIMRTGEDVDIKYVRAPNGYVEHTAANTEVLNKYFTPEYDFDSGMQIIIGKLEEEHEKIYSNDND